MCQGLATAPDPCHNTNVIEGDHMTTISREAATELRELIEDTIEYFCDEEKISGETAWKMVECLAVAKQAQMQGLVD